MLEPENDKKKKTIWVGALATAGLTVIPVSLYYFRLASVLNMQVRQEDAGFDGSSETFYDSACFISTEWTKERIES